MELKERLNQDITEFKNLKYKCEQDIASEISKILDEFQDKTGLKVGYVVVDLIGLETLGDYPKSIVSNVNVYVEMLGE